MSCEVEDGCAKKGTGTQQQEVEKFLIDVLECKTRSQMWDFLSCTEYDCDTVSLNEAMAAMTDDQVQSWFPRVCAEYFCQKILM